MKNTFFPASSLMLSSVSTMVAADIASQRLDADNHTSRDNPVWGFLTNLECVLERIDAK